MEFSIAQTFFLQKAHTAHFTEPQSLTNFGKMHKGSLKNFKIQTSQDLKYNREMS